MKKIITLHDLPLGKTAIIKEIRNEPDLRIRLTELGFSRGAAVRALQRSPSGDPVAYEIKGTVIALRAGETRQILVELEVV
ncbi:MAG: ferrous iron transport protein A [Clostridiales bacterium]|nr:ferrous iron transport protein A [Clostridiales bacterium]